VALVDDLVFASRSVREGVGSARESVEKSRRTARRRLEWGGAVAPRRRVAEGERGSRRRCAPTRRARTEKRPRRPARRENLGNEETRGVCAPARPPHRTAWWTKPGAVSGRALSADSFPCAGSGVLAREGSRGLSSSRKITPAALQPPTKLDRAHFRAPGVLVKASIGSHFKRERARGWGTTDRSPAHEAFRRSATRTPPRASLEFARAVSRSDPG
jgi:hypothetical protein